MAEGTNPQAMMEKFEFYFLGLTFTLLAVSVQSYKPSASLSADVVQTIGWATLLISGLFGLSKLEWIPAILLTQSRQAYVEQARDDLKKTKAQNLPLTDSKDGRRLDPSEMIERTERTLNEIKSSGLKMDRSHELKHKGQKALFLVGVAAIVASRADDVIRRVLDTLK